MHRQDSERLRHLIGILDQLKAFNPNMPLKLAAAFLHIAVRPGINITELAQASQTILQTASRHAHALAGPGREGAGSLVAVGYGHDGRTKALLLTDEGRRLSNAVATAMITAS